MVTLEAMTKDLKGSSK